MATRRAAARGVDKAEGVASSHDARRAAGTPAAPPRASQRAPYKLLAFEQLPAWMADNEFIRSGYRCDWPLGKTLRSVFELHNETLNIWTHLGGFLVFVGLTVYTACVLREPAGGADLPEEWHAWAKTVLKGSWPLAEPTTAGVARWPLVVYLVGAMCCLLASTVCHTLAPLGEKKSRAIWRFDYAAISVMIATSFFPPVYYCFLCMPRWRAFYLGTISVLGTSLIVFSMRERFQTVRWRPIRTGLYVLLGFFGVVPLLHQHLFIWKTNPAPIATALKWEVLMGVLYLAAAIVYVIRVPERFLPGKFDLFMHSHNVFHVLIFAAALAHWEASYLLLRWRDHHQCEVDEGLFWR